MYGIKDEKDVYLLDEDPTLEEAHSVMRTIAKRIKDGKKETPARNFVIICLFAGHGILMDGFQVLLVNEYNSATMYYKMFTAEKIIRHYASKYSNSYWISIFACCRQLYSAKTMKGNCHPLSA